MTSTEIPIRIHDLEDSRIDAYRDVRERDLVGRKGFIAEGRVVIEPLLASRRFRPLSLLVLENRLAGLAPLLARVPAGVPTYLADRATFDGIAGFSVHRGLLAHGEALADPDEALRLPAIAAAGGTVVVAVGIANHDNIGAIFRNAAAFGADAVLIDETSCDPLYRKAIRVSAGSVFTVPYERVGAADDALARLLDAGFRCLALSPGAAAGLAPLDQPGPAALFLGAEGPGLPAELAARMSAIRIPMVPGFDSINVATAAAVALHRLYSRRPPAD
ncbi:TrmH family RNA methyltransferase [Aureimonas glaciei]|uniref:RNA methyltransferase n=1 Tax=Aureimonas glaciei TaxID=1776957 RepID=A0A916XTU6_9HYPH|nr:RNA methyltransferase [Aureimonas glaciei]GGD09890.1 RNA methyltransferase [Aureimonas glaciei]